MLFTLYPTITQNYFILCFVACLGILQWAAARKHNPVLSLSGRRGLGRPGQGIGLFLVCGSFGWFFAVTPGLFAPGLAGGELSSLFVTAGLCALLVTRLAAIVWNLFSPF